MTSHVAPLRTIVLVRRLLGSQLVTRGRVLAVAAVGFFTAVITGLLARSADNSVESSRLVIDVLSNLGFVLVVPIVALVFAGATFGDLRDDYTLVYLWLRPMDRLPVVLGAYLAAVAIAVPIAALSLGVAAIAGGVSVSTLLATVVAASLGVLAYAALFVLLGLVIRNSIVWGLAYILVWEGLLTGLFSAVARTSILGYVRAVLANLADVRVGGALDVTTPVALGVLLVGAAAVLAIATYRLDRMEID